MKKILIFKKIQIHLYLILRKQIKKIKTILYIRKKTIKNKIQVSMLKHKIIRKMKMKNKVFYYLIRKYIVIRKKKEK